MSEDILLFDKDQRGVVTVTLNRPEVHNAFDDAVIEKLIDAIDRIRQDPDSRVMVLRSNGKHFSAGADLGWMKRMATLDYSENVADAGRLALLMSSLNALDVPVLTIVQGAAYAGALGLICCSDYTLASERASFCVSEVKLGLSPAVISPYVVAVIGERNARRYFLSAEVFDAAEAKRMNLVTEITSGEQLNERAEAIIANWLNMGPSAVARTKQLIRRVAGSVPDEDTIGYTRELIASIRVSEEGQEGLSAFFDKRKPRWQNP